MDITLNKKDTTSATIKIKLNEADYQSKVEEKIKDYSKKANIKGFRPGKVPTGMIKKMYGKSILVDEINHMLTHSVSDYIKTEKLPIIGEPLPDRDNANQIDWETQKEFEFQFKVGMHSEFKLDLNKKITVEKLNIAVDKKIIDETLENLRKQFGTNSSPEKSEKGDFIYGQLNGPNDFDKYVFLSINKVADKEQKKFVGLAKDDKVEVDIKKTFDNNLDEIANFTGLSKEEAEKLSGKYEMSVSSIQRNAPAEMNQEFFDKVFGKDAVLTEEEFLNKVKETIAQNYVRESDFLFKKKTQDALIDAIKIELPADFLKEYLFTINNGKFSKEQIEKEFKQYSNEIKWNLIRNKIVSETGIKVEHEEVMAEAKNLIKERYMNAFPSAEMDQILDALADNFLKHEDGKNYRELFEKSLDDKVFNYIKDQISVKEKNVDVEEFKKIAQN